jgi:hypothetical protein
MTTFGKLLLVVGIMCLALAGWSLIRGEVHDAIFGLGLGALLLWCWRWALRQTTKSSPSG